MKKLLLFLLLCAAFPTAYAQNIISVQDGNWSATSTWDCGCSPSFTDNITVAHDVILDQPWPHSAGNITINSGASLTKDITNPDLLFSGDTLNNQGTLDLHYLQIENGAVTLNSGTASIKSFANYGQVNNFGVLTNIDSFYNSNGFVNESTGSIFTSTFYNDDVLNNQGSMTNIDSMMNAGVLTIGTNGILEADSATNISGAILTNDGRITYSRFTNIGTVNNNNHISLLEMTNTGTFNNNDSLVATGSVLNLGSFNNAQLAVEMVGGSFHNGLTPAVGATYTNEGYVQADGSWHNFEIITGTNTGSFQVSDTSSNFGTMSGDFDFCDLSIGFWVTSPPYIDLNQGTIGPGITWCTPAGIDDLSAKSSFSVFPNPTTEAFTVKFDEDLEIRTITIINTLGEEVANYPVLNLGQLTIPTEHLNPGIYLIRALGADGELSKQVVVQ